MNPVILNLKNLFLVDGEHKYWAVITGATDGIGLAFARALAKKKYNLLLISRSLRKLEDTFDLLRFIDLDIKIEFVVADFRDRNIYSKIDDYFKNIEIDENIRVLINNVGICYPSERPEYFHLIEDLDNFIDDIINVNIISHTRMISIILKKMLVNKNGIIINMSSVSAISSVPFLAIYSASKVLNTSQKYYVQIFFKKPRI